MAGIASAAASIARGTTSVARGTAGITRSTTCVARSAAALLLYLINHSLLLIQAFLKLGNISQALCAWIRQVCTHKFFNRFTRITLQLWRIRMLSFKVLNHAKERRKAQTHELINMLVNQNFSTRQIFLDCFV